MAVSSQLSCLSVTPPVRSKDDGSGLTISLTSLCTQIHLLSHDVHVIFTALFGPL
jgi:hypothetical protein